VGDRPNGVDRRAAPNADDLGPAIEPLHVTNGESAASTLRATQLGGDVLSWDDVLHEGPLAPVEPQRLRELRAAFLSRHGWGSPESIRARLKRRDATLREALERGRPVVVWLEHDLFDQLQLLQILALVAGQELDAPAVELLVVGEMPGRPDFHGLGELSATELEALWPARVPLTAEVLETGRAGWAALCEPDPRSLEAFAAAARPGLPYLRPALERLLEELPDTSSGLSRTERQLLEAVAAGAGTPVDALLECGRREEAPFAGDTWVWLRLRELGAGPGRLLEQTAGDPLPPAPPLGDAATFTAARLRVTDAGRSVLAGERDRVELLGIDRWLGGTHLLPDTVWRWDPRRRVVVAPAP
jgi:hypothetical protein